MCAKLLSTYPQQLIASLSKLTRLKTSSVCDITEKRNFQPSVPFRGRVGLTAPLPLEKSKLRRTRGGPHLLTLAGYTRLFGSPQERLLIVVDHAWREISTATDRGQGS